MPSIEHFKSTVTDITLPDNLSVKIENHPEGRMYLQVYKHGTCNRTGVAYKEGGRKWDISTYATESEVVLTAFKAALTFIEHELREGFMYKGKRILDPHIDVNALLDVCEKLDRRE